MAEKLYSYADKQVMDEVGSGGSSGSTMIIHVDENDTLDKTWKQIHDHMFSGGMAIIVGMGVNNNNATVVGSALIDKIEGTLFYTIETGTAYFNSFTENGYPVLQ